MFSQIFFTPSIGIGKIDTFAEMATCYSHKSFLRVVFLCGSWHRQRDTKNSLINRFSRCANSSYFDTNETTSSICNGYSLGRICVCCLDLRLDKPEKAKWGSI